MVGLTVVVRDRNGNTTIWSGAEAAYYEDGELRIQMPATCASDSCKRDGMLERVRVDSIRDAYLIPVAREE